MARRCWRKAKSRRHPGSRRVWPPLPYPFRLPLGPFLKRLPLAGGPRQPPPQRHRPFRAGLTAQHPLPAWAPRRPGLPPQRGTNAQVWRHLTALPPLGQTARMLQAQTVLPAKGRWSRLPPWALSCRLCRHPPPRLPGNGSCPWPAPSSLMPRQAGRQCRLFLPRRGRCRYRRPCRGCPLSAPGRTAPLRQPR